MDCQIYGDVPQGATLALQFHYFDLQDIGKYSGDEIVRLRWHLGERPLRLRLRFL
jgi:hypothetical protein